MIVAIAVVVYQFTGNDSAEPQTAMPAGAAKPVKKAPVLMAHSLDPTLRFDLLKSSEDVTYKGTGRDIFRSTAPPPDIPPEVQKVINTPPPPPPPPPIPLKFYGYEGGKGGAN